MLEQGGCLHEPTVELQVLRNDEGQLECLALSRTSTSEHLNICLRGPRSPDLRHLSANFLIYIPAVPQLLGILHKARVLLLKTILS
jgi:hypothetical protein